MADIRDVIKDIVPKQDKLKWGKPISSYKLTFDSQQAKLEPIYYWILDFINDMGWKTEKITDNFTSSPGSGHFSEMGTKQTTMQKQAMETLGALNQVIKSVYTKSIGRWKRYEKEIIAYYPILEKWIKEFNY